MGWLHAFTVHLKRQNRAASGVRMFRNGAGINVAVRAGGCDEIPVKEAAVLRARR
jgi:hypothetical protein